jgi:hypothetical protein
MSKEYIGDGVYANPNDGGIELTTENGIDIDNTIYLEWSVMKTLIAFYGKIKGELK